MNEIRPPNCFICKENYEDKVGTLYYCLSCDIAICNKCIDELKINDSEWQCPKCEDTNNIKESKLFRTKT